MAVGMAAALVEASLSVLAPPASGWATGAALGSAVRTGGGGDGCFAGSMGAPEQAAAVTGAAPRRRRAASDRLAGGLSMGASYGFASEPARGTWQHPRCPVGRRCSSGAF